MFPNQFMTGNGHGFPNNQSQGFMNGMNGMNSMLNGNMMNVNTMQQQQQESNSMGMMNSYGNNITSNSYSDGNNNYANMDEMREAQLQEEAFSRAQQKIQQEQQDLKTFQELISQSGKQTGQFSIGNVPMEKEEEASKNFSKEYEQGDKPLQDVKFIPRMLPLELEMYGTPEQKERYLAVMQYQQDVEEGKEDANSTSMSSQMMSDEQIIQQKIAKMEETMQQNKQENMQQNLQENIQQEIQENVQQNENMPFSQMMINQEQMQVMNNQVVQMGNFNNGGQVLGRTFIVPVQPTIVCGNGVYMNRNINNFGNQMNSVPTGNASIEIPASSNMSMQGYTMSGNMMMRNNGISPVMNMNPPSLQARVIGDVRESIGQLDYGATGSMMIPSLSALAPSYNPYAVDMGINSEDHNMMSSDDEQNDTSALLDQTMQQSNIDEQNDTSLIPDQTLQQLNDNEQNDAYAPPDQTLQQSNIDEQNDTPAMPDHTLQQSHNNDQNESDKDWKGKYNLLTHYKTANGHVNVPSDYHMNGINLGRFVQKQKELCRVFYSSGCDEKCGLNNHQCKLLECIGLVETKIPGNMWLKRYRELENFREKHGHCNVSRSTDKSLGNWVRNQRQLYRKYMIGTPTAMTEEKIILLKRIGFAWKYEGKTKEMSSIGNSYKGEYEDNFIDNFIPEDTVETYPQYQKDSQNHIHSGEENVAKSSDCDKNRVGPKVVDEKQRHDGLSRASKDFLSVDYAPQIVVDGKKLSHILFSKTPHIFYVEDDNSETDVHEEESVQSWSSEYDDEADSEDNALSDDNSNDSEDSDYDEILRKIAREPNSGYNTNRHFIKRLQELVKFKKKFGHVKVSKGADRTSLGCWVSTQRAKHRKYVQGEASTLTELRIAALVKIGVTFPHSNVTKVSLEEIVEKVLPKRGQSGRCLVSRQTAWDLRFQELLEYKMKHGHCLVREGSQTLINWTKHQRQRYKKYTRLGCRAITDNQVQRMNEIGFSWTTPCSTNLEKTKLKSEGMEAFDTLDDEFIYRVLGFLVDDINAIISFFSTSTRFVSMMNTPRSSDSLFRECYESLYGIGQVWKMSESKTYNESSWLDILREWATFEYALNLLRDIDDGQVHVDDFGADSESYVRNEDGLGILSRKDEFTSLISENINLTPKGTSDSWSKGYSGMEIFTVEGKEGESKSSDVFFAIFGDFNGIRIIKSLESLLDEGNFHHEFKSVGTKRIGKVACALSVPQMSFTNSSQNNNPRRPVLIVGTEAGGIASIFPVKNKGTVAQYGIVSMNYTHETEVTCLSLLPTSRMKHDALDMLISAGNDGKAFVYPHSLSSHPHDFELHNCALCIKNNAPITSLISTIVDDTILVVTGDKNGKVALWRAKNPSSFADGVDFEFEKISKVTSAFGSNKVFVEKICLLNDRTIASGSSRGDIFVWHIQEKNSKKSDRQYKLVKTWTKRNAHSSKITSMTPYADILLTTGKGDNTTIAWSLSGVRIAMIKNGANLTNEDFLSQPDLSKAERQVYSYKGLQSSIVCNLVCDKSLLSLSRDGTICRWFYRDFLEQEILKSPLQSTEKRKIEQDQSDNAKRVKIDQAVEQESVGNISEYSDNDIDSDSSDSVDDFDEDDVDSESSDEEDIESDNDFDWQ